MPKKRTNKKRQAGSLKVWLNETNGLVHEVVLVHQGRVTMKYVGPEAKTVDTAHQFITNDLKRLD